MTGYVIDDTVIDAFAFADSTVVATLFGLTQRNIRVSVPAIALAHAQATLSDDQCAEVNSMIDHLETFRLEPIASITEATALGRILGQINDETASEDFAAAHALAVAKRLGWPIATTSLIRWEPITRVLQIDVREMRDSPE